MPIERIVIVGAGGHAKVVLDAFLLTHHGIAAQVWDEAPGKAGTELLGLEVRLLGSGSRIGGAFHVAIGDALARERLAQVLRQGGATLVSIAHPSASVSSFALVGEGSFVAAHAVLAAGAALGLGAIVNHGAVVDHDCMVGDWSHIAPNATLGGNVTIGRAATVGAGATVLPGLKVGEGAVIGAGSVVAADVAPHATVKGIPARAA